MNYLTRANNGSTDFSLKKMVFSPEISAKVQSGAVSLVIVPVDPQPVINHQELNAAGLSIEDAPSLMRAVRVAFQIGLIGGDVVPIQNGHAFELLQELPPQRLARFGTGRVKTVGITRFDDLGEHDWIACGYTTLVEFQSYWARCLPNMPAETNPWCWLIHFEFKG